MSVTVMDESGKEIGRSALTETEITTGKAGLPAGWQLTPPTGRMYTKIMPAEGHVWGYNTQTGARRAFRVVQTLGTMPVQTPTTQTPAHTSALVGGTISFAGRDVPTLYLAGAVLIGLWLLTK